MGRQINQERPFLSSIPPLLEAREKGFMGLPALPKGGNAVLKASSFKMDTLSFQ